MLPLVKGFSAMLVFPASLQTTRSLVCLVLCVFTTTVFYSSSGGVYAQEPPDSVVARTKMQLRKGDDVIDVIEQGDLLKVVEARKDYYVILTMNGNRGIVGKDDALLLTESVETYNRLIENNPTQGRLLTLRASAWWARGDTAKALADYDRAIDQGYKEPHAYSSRGLFHAALGNYEKAILDFNTAIERGAKDEAAYINRAAIYLSIDRPDMALKDYNEAVIVAPNSPTAYHLRAVLHKSQGKLEAAISDFTKAIEVDPKHEDSLMGRGFVWFQKDYWRKAIEDFSAVIRINPNSARAYNNRGYNRQLVGDFAEALKDYEEAIRLAPKFGLAYQNKAWLLASADDAKVRSGKKAIEAATKACELTEYKNVGDIKALAAAFAEDGQFPTAVKWQVKAIELSDEDFKPFEQEVLEHYRNKKPIRLADFQGDDAAP